MKKALGNNKLTNKCQHLGENRAVSKWQGVFQVEPGRDGEKRSSTGESAPGKGRVQSRERKAAGVSEDQHRAQCGWSRVGGKRGRRKARGPPSPC